MPGMKLKIATWMKRAGTRSTAKLLLITATCLWGFTACAQLKSWLTQPGTVEQLAPATTNLVAIITTNSIVVPAQTNAAGEITPPMVQVQLVTNLAPVIQPATYFTNLVLSPMVQSSIAAADT